MVECPIGMTKMDRLQALNERFEGDIWDEENLAEWYIYNGSDEWDSVLAGNMSWQWYMEANIRKPEGWTQVVIDPKWKGATVANWLKTHHPDCDFKCEKDHFLIKDPNVATWMTLKWT